MNREIWQDTRPIGKIIFISLWVIMIGCLFIAPLVLA